MTVQTSFRTMTPPKYAEALDEKRQRVVLEQRLAHFIEWLRTEHDVELCLWTAGQQRRLTFEEHAELVKEYVNT